VARFFRAPNLNAFVEQFMPSNSQVALHQFLVFGEMHSDALSRAQTWLTFDTELPH
jgi:hypothetical protein